MRADTSSQEVPSYVLKVHGSYWSAFSLNHDWLKIIVSYHLLVRCKGHRWGFNPQAHLAETILLLSGCCSTLHVDALGLGLLCVRSSG